MSKRNSTMLQGLFCWSNQSTKSVFLLLSFQGLFVRFHFFQLLKTVSTCTKYICNSNQKLQAFGPKMRSNSQFVLPVFLRRQLILFLNKIEPNVMYKKNYFIRISFFLSLKLKQSYCVLSKSQLISLIKILSALYLITGGIPEYTIEHDQVSKQKQMYLRNQ